jgi:hypothetical protein
MPTVLDAVRPIVDQTINRLGEAKFVVDPIAGPELSKITSITSSAYKRHGAIIEIALFHAIAQRNNLEAESKVPFYVNRHASAYVEGHDFRSSDGLNACLRTSFPYSLEGAQHELDIIYFDHERRSIVALEVKRGNGEFDRGKRDSLIKSALAVRTLLSSYAEARGWHAESVESRILAYYGVPKFPEEIYLRGADLDTFIAPGIWSSVEEVNDYFRACLLDLLQQETRQKDLFH